MAKTEPTKFYVGYHHDDGHHEIRECWLLITPKRVKFARGTRPPSHRGVSYEWQWSTVPRRCGETPEKAAALYLTMLEEGMVSSQNVARRAEATLADARQDLEKTKVQGREWEDDSGVRWKAWDDGQCVFIEDAQDRLASAQCSVDWARALFAEILRLDAKLSRLQPQGLIDVPEGWNETEDE